MNSHLPPKPARATMLALAFWLLFAFWCVALYFGLRGGVITYSLLLTAILLSLKASRAKAKATQSNAAGD